MNIKYPATSNGDTDLLQSVSQQLEEIAGKSVIQASAEWELVRDSSGNRRYLLKVSDYTAQVTEEFTPYELRSPREMRSRLLHLWGDLLQVSSHRLLEMLTESATEH